MVRCNKMLWFQDPPTDGGLIPFSTRPCGKEAVLFYRFRGYEARCQDCDSKEKKSGFKAVSKEEYVAGSVHEA